MQHALIEALRRHDFAAAAEAARQLLASEPDSADAHHGLGLAQRGLGDIAGATESFERAVSLAPDNSVFHLSLASLAMANQDVEAARRALDQAVSLDPNQLGAYVTLAHLALANKDLAEAERQLKLVFRVDPDHPYALVVQGNVEAAKGDRDAALATLQRAARLSPDDPLVQSSLGLAYLVKGHYAFAEQALRNALAKQPSARRLRWALVETLRQQNRMLETLPELSALSEDPRDAAAVLLRGTVELASGQREQALATFGGYLRFDETRLRELPRITQHLLAAGMHDELVALLDELLERYPRHDPLWGTRAGVVAADKPAYKAVVDRWLEALPDSATANEFLAHYLEAEGDFAGAEALVDRVLAADERRDGAQMLKLRCEVRERPEDALARLDKLEAVARAPAARRMVLGWRGVALDRLGRYGDAIAAWTAMNEVPAGGPPLPMVVAGVDNPREVDAAHPVPTLLWGAPGSNVERVATALARTEGVQLLGDRLTPSPRADGLWPPREDGAVADAAVWGDILASGGVDPARAVDWLPHLDARTFAALPGARLLAVLRDPRTMLLNWWVFGSPQGFEFPRLEIAAEWLALVLAAVADRRDAAPDQVVLMRGEAIDADAAAACDGLAAALGLPAVPPADVFAAMAAGPGVLPNGFAAGHWQHYREALSAAFEKLEGIAQRLGY